MYVLESLYNILSYVTPSVVVIAAGW